MPRRIACLWSLVGAVGPGLALACAPVAPVPPAAPPGATGQQVAPAPPAAPAAEAPKLGGIFHYSEPARATRMDPNTVFGSAGSAGLQHVYDPLLGLQLDASVNPMVLNLRPKLAESWKVDSDTTYTFNLRRNVKWHDGQPFTAHDVVATYRRMMDSKDLPGKSILSSVAGLDAADDYTVKMSTKEPDAALLRSLTYGSQYMSIVPKHILDAGADLNKTYVGTGPFKITAHDGNVKTTYQKNDAYYLPGQPYMDGMVLFYGLERNAQLAAFQASNIDVYQGTDRKQFEPTHQQLGDKMGYEIMTNRGTWQVMFRVDQKPFDDVRVRKAIHLLIDRQALKQVVAFGDGVINPPLTAAVRGKWALPQEDLLRLPGYRQPKDADVAEAKRLLAEAGYGSGLKYTAIASVTSSTAPKILPVYAEQMRRAGIDVEQQILENALYTKRQESGDFQSLVQHFGGSGDPDGDLLQYHSKGARNFYGFNDPDLDALIEKQRRTLDEEERVKVVHQIQRFALDKALVASTIDPAVYVMWRNWVHGFRAFAVNFTASLLASEQIWMDKEQVPPR